MGKGEKSSRWRGPAAEIAWSVCRAAGRSGGWMVVKWKKVKLEMQQGRTKGLMGTVKGLNLILSGGLVLKVEDF